MQEASWTNPHEGADAAGDGGVEAAGASGIQDGGGDTAVSQVEDGRAKWTECLDEASGATYYYNVLTVSRRNFILKSGKIISATTKSCF